ncbi:choice-of-anchor D domain-containing protein [Winogradskyella sp. A2]|uniref:choice-of-anchor D domain-containing protein n=1 Tax=Winogradskyella sp. A2 TaxID=3366944 RepID=UPI00398C6A72
MKTITHPKLRAFVLMLFTTVCALAQTPDYNVQHLQDDIANTGGSNTGFTAVSSTASAFALANNNRKVSAGVNGNGGNLAADDLSGARVLTATNTLTYYRQAGSIASNTRFNTSIWEYVGPVGGANEMIVRGRYAVSLNGATNSVTQGLSGITNANDCIPFITGILTNDGAAGADTGTAVAYLENATTLRVQKGTNTNNVTVYVTVVEFTGSNWTVLHGDSGNVAGDTGTITLRDGSDGTGTATNVSAWSDAVMFSHHRADNAASGVNQAIEDNWPVMAPGSNNQSVDWTFSGGHLSDGTNRQFVHVLANTNLNVTRYTNTSNAANATTIDITSAGLSNVNEALIVGTSISSGGGTAYGRGWRNYYLNSTTQAAHWAHRSGNTMSHNIQIVDLSGLVTLASGPEMNVQGNATTIADGDTTPATADDTDFGSVSTISSQANIFTIQNLGTTNLNLTGGSPYVTIGGTHAADFTITIIPGATIASSGSTTFEITFTPGAAGLRTATVSIANDDSDENPYNFNIQGTGTTPSYCAANGNNDSFEYIGNVTLNTINNTSVGGTTSTGYSDFTGISTSLTQGAVYPISITPVWTGTVYTEGFAVYIDFNQDYDFADAGELVFTAGPDTVSPQLGNITIPGGATVGNTRMRVIMDDANLPVGPCGTHNYGEVEDYTITIAASSPLAEINVTGNGTNIVSGDITPSTTDNTDFGNVDIAGGTQANSFIIENLGGTNTLNLTGASPYAIIGGTHAADFTVTTIPSNAITAGSNTTFIITFDPSALGIRTATVTIANDDSDENPYTFSIQGNGFVPPPCGSTVVHTANFESGLDGWTSGGADASRQNNATWSYQGSYSLRVRNVDAVGSTTSFDSQAFDLSNYNKVDFKFFFAPNSVEDTEEFMLEYSSDNGTNWTTVQIFEGGSIAAKTADFESTTSAIFYGKIVTLKDTDYTFPASTVSRFRLRCNASATDDEVYIDEITITGTSYCTPTEGPGGVSSDLDLWLRADMIDGVDEDADGALVSDWFDNGKGNHASTMVSGLEPVYRDNTTNNINFNPVVEFENNNNTANSDMTYIISDGSRDELTGTGGFNSADMFVVIVPDPTITTTMIPLDTFTSSDPTVNDIQAEDVTGFGYGAYSQRFTNEYFGYCLGTSQAGPPITGYGRGDTAGTVDYNQIGIINIRHNGAVNDMDMYLNGNTIGNVTSDAPDFSTVANTKYWLGRSQYWNGSFDGRIAEVITYSSTQNDGDATQARNRIQSYLAIKYGITLGVNGTSQDYVNSDGTVIWDQSADAAAYNYDIAGIGRDDASELIQKQSSSINNATDVDGPIEGVITVGLTDIYNTNKENKDLNATTLGDKEFLVWGNDGTDLNLAASTITVNMSAGIAPALTTDVTFTAMQRTWKFVETGGDIPEVKVSIPQNAVRNITPPGHYYMFISDTGIFDPTADYRVMTADGSGNLETTYDFDGTKFVTFGYAPQIIAERSVYFDGAADYIDVDDRLDLNPAEFTISAWIKRDAADTGTASIVSKRDATFTEGYDLRILNDNRIEIIWKNGTDQSLISNTSIPDDEWHEVAAIYDGTRVSLYIDGVEDNTANRTAPVATNENFYIAAAGKNTPTQFFRGNIDEVRVWDAALSEDELRFVMNQEISDNSGQVMGNELPTSISRNDIDVIPWTDLAGYYPMSIYTYTNTDDLSGNGNQGALRNLDTVDRQTTPLPYESTQNGDWDTDTTWTNGDVNVLPGTASIVDNTITVDWNIVRTSHDITMDNSSLPAGNNDIRTVLGLYVDANELTIDGDNSTDTGHAINVSHYLSLTGKLDLEGESQLIQEEDSDLDVAVNGELERDQQGTADTFTYNYWSAPVGDTDIATNNYSYALQDIFYDGTNAVNFDNASLNGAATSPITIADYWIWKYANQPSDNYASWQHVRSTGTLNAGEGFTMKGPGTGVILAEQNYVYLGKPNNGDINLTITGGNDYLLGNPYASAIDADQFIRDNGPELQYTDPGSTPESNPLLSGTLYFWEHWGGGSHILQEYQGGYATYNYSGAVAAASIGTNDPDVGTGGTPTKLPGRYIPVGQGFFVVGENTGTINFNNGQRVFQKEGGASSVFVRNATAQNSSDNQVSDERMKFRIGFNSVNTIHRQLLLTIDENTTEGVDWAYDAVLNEEQIDDMYWIINDEAYMVQANSEAEVDTVYPLGVKTDTDGNNTITIDELENVPSDVNIYLHDKVLEIYHDLRASDYSIFLNAGEYLDRFEITFGVNGDALGIDDIESESLDVLYSNDIEKIVLINPNLIEVSSIELFNILGQSVHQIENISESGYSEYDVENLSTGTYIIKLYTASGSVSTKKVLVK